MTNDAEDFLSGGGKAFSFDKIGDSVTGEVLSAVKRQQTELDSSGRSTGKPKFFDSGDPMFMLVVTLQTDIRDSDDDDGVRTLYLRKGNYVAAEGKGMASANAVADAVRRVTGRTALPEGSTLTLTYTGHGPKKGALNPAKLYTAQFKPPVTNIDLDEMA